MASTIDDITAIRTRFRTQWEAMHPSVRFIYDNEPAIDEPDTVYVRLSIRPGKERRLSMFQRQYEEQGRIWFQVIVPRFTKDADAWALSATFGNVFRDWHSNDRRIRCDTVDTKVVDIPDDDFIIESSVYYVAIH